MEPISAQDGDEVKEAATTSFQKTKTRMGLLERGSVIEINPLPVLNMEMHLPPPNNAMKEFDRVCTNFALNPIRSAVSEHFCLWPRLLFVEAPVREDKDFVASINSVKLPGGWSKNPPGFEKAVYSAVFSSRPGEPWRSAIVLWTGSLSAADVRKTGQTSIRQS